jgi:hypothetical protein
MHNRTRSGRDIPGSKEIRAGAAESNSGRPDRQETVGRSAVNTRRVNPDGAVRNICAQIDRTSWERKRTWLRPEYR